MKKIYALLLFLCGLFLQVFAQNTPCAAIVLPNNMNGFQTYSTAGMNNSGVPYPGCGGNVGVDIWFSVVAPPSGNMYIALQGGTMVNAAMALYLGPCNNLSLQHCATDANCGPPLLMPAMQEQGLIPGQTYFIRVWPEGTGGTFSIRVTDGDPVQPLLNMLPVGSATPTSPYCMRMTQPVPAQAGCAWDPDQINFTQPFTRELLFNFGNNPAGADGICMVFQSSPAGLNACGVGGGGIAAEGITNSFIIEFDTWNNGPAFGDIPPDHVAINVNGNMIAPIAGPVQLLGGNIEDGLDHLITFIWNPATNGYTVRFDGVQVLAGTYNIVANCFGGNPLAYFGVTASTGGAFNLQTVCTPAPPLFPVGSRDTVYAQICQGQTYFAGGGNQVSPGIYTDNFPAFNGCDSTIVTFLTVLPQSFTPLNAFVCIGECVTIGNQTYCTQGTHNTVLSNVNGCDSTVILNLTVLNPQINIVASGPISCQNPIITLNATSSSTGPGMTFLWTGPPGCITGNPASPFIGVTCPGTYTLTLTHQAVGVSCSVMQTFTVTENIEAINVILAEPSSLSCLQSCTQLSSAGSPSGPGYQYAWTGPNGFSSSQPNPQACVPGAYTLTITNTLNGCSGSETVQVTGNIEVPEAEAGADQVLNCTNPEQVLDAGASTGNNLVFAWFESGVLVGSDPTLLVGSTGLYELVLTDTLSGCQDIDTVLVTENFDTPLADAGTDQVLDCTQSSVQLDGSGSSSGPLITYLWQNSNQNILGDSNTQEVSAAGTYTLIVLQTESGCSDTSQVEVIQDLNAPVANPGTDVLLTCTITEIVLDGSGSSQGAEYEYGWFDEQAQVLGNGNTLSVQTPGVYTLVVTNTLNNCVDSAMVQVSIDTLSPLAEAGPEGVLSCAAASWLLGDSLVVAPPNWAFNWQNQAGVSISQQPSHPVSVPGLYTLTVTNLTNGCTAIDSALIISDDDVPSADPGVSGVLTCQQTDWLLGGPGTSTGLSIEYTWTNSAGDSVGSDAEYMANVPDTYILEVLNTDNGCLSTASVTVAQDTLSPLADAGNSEELNCFQPSLVLSAGAAVPASIEYTWQDEAGQNQQQADTLTVSQAGWYILQVYNPANGCSSTDSVLITEDFTLPQADAGADQAINCQVAQVMLDGGNSSVGANILYSWADSSGAVLGNQLQLEVSSGGTYTLLVSNTENGCSAVDSVVVSADYDGPVADVGQAFTLSCDQADGLLGGSNTSSGADISLQWEDENGAALSQQPNLLVSAPGVYTLLVTNTLNGCIDSQSVEITQDTLSPIADAGSGGTITCNQPSLLLGGGSSVGAGIIYSWTDEFGNTISTAAQTSVGQAGQYQLIVFNQTNGCSSSAEVLIQEDLDEPVATPGTDTLLNCYNPSILLDGSGSTAGVNIQYTWLNELGTPLGNTPTLSVSQPGTYTLEVLNIGNGCSAVGNIDVDANQMLPMAAAPNLLELNCSEPELVLDGTGSTQGGSITYTWTLGGQTLGNGLTQSIDMPGNYTLQVFNTENGCSSTAQVVVLADFQAPLASAGADVLLTCLNTSTVLDGVGSAAGPGIQYSWTDMNGTLLGQGIQLPVASAGTYTLTVMNTNNGCQSSDDVQVMEDFAEPVVQVASPVTTTCANPIVSLNGQGSSAGVSFVAAWFDTQNNLVSNNLVTQVSLPGTYTLLITNTGNGCQSSATVTVVQNQVAPVAVLQSTDVLTCVQLTAGLNASGSSEGPAIQYNWNTLSGGVIQTGANPLMASVTQPGNYQLIVTDLQNGCADTAVVQITQNITPPVANAGMDATLTCFEPEQVLDGSGSQPAGLLSFAWSTLNGQLTGNTSSPSPVAAAPGSYILLVTNTVNGCTSTDVVVIDAILLEDFEWSVSDPNCPGDFGQIELGAVTGGSPPYLYSIDGGQSFMASTLFSNLEAGNFVVVVQDSDGCTLEALVSISAPPQLEILLDPTIEALLGEQIVLTPSLNVLPEDVLSIQWFPSEGLSCDTCLRPSLQPAQSIAYTIRVVHSNGCEAQARVQVLVDGRPRVYAPNVFSPNDDGFNDQFLLFASDGHVRSIRQLSVYSRWGEQVFAATNIQPNDLRAGWDGRFRGQRLDPAVFVWMAEVELADGRIEWYRGDVTLVR